MQEEKQVARFPLNLSFLTYQRKERAHIRAARATTTNPVGTVPSHHVSTTDRFIPSTTFYAWRAAWLPWRVSEHAFLWPFFQCAA